MVENASALATTETGAMQVWHEWTPEALKEAVEREKALRKIVTEYYRSQMQQGHHFFNLTKGDERKPALSKDGAMNLCSLFKVVAQPEPPVEMFHEDGHYTVRYRVNLVSLRTGETVATGDGSCSTRESKYAYRWVFPDEVPLNVDKAGLQSREFKRKSGNGTFTKYKLPNEDLADQYNTVLKMADKRGTVAATLKLPLVSELFTQDLEEQIEHHAQQKGSTEAMINQSQYDEIGGLAKKLIEAGAWADYGPLAEEINSLFKKAGRKDLTSAEADELIDVLIRKIEGKEQSKPTITGDDIPF